MSGEEAERQEKPEALKEEEKEMSVAQIKERDARTVFVGNLNLELKARELTRLFKKKAGKVEKCWFRSIPLERMHAPAIDQIK